MKLKIELKKLVRAPLIVLEVLVTLLTFLQVLVSAGLLFAVPFAIITVLMVRYIYLTLLMPGCRIHDEFEFSFEKLTQSCKGEKLKEISLGYGLHTYRYAGILRTTLVFSRKELPQGELIKKYRNDPEVIYLPYMPRKMPKLKKYVEKSTRI